MDEIAGSAIVCNTSDDCSTVCCKGKPAVVKRKCEERAPESCAESHATERKKAIRNICMRNTVDMMMNPDRSSFVPSRSFS